MGLVDEGAASAAASSNPIAMGILVILKLLELAPLLTHAAKNDPEISDKLVEAEKPEDTIALLTEFGKGMGK